MAIQDVDRERLKVIEQLRELRAQRLKLDNEARRVSSNIMRLCEEIKVLRKEISQGFRDTVKSFIDPNNPNKQEIIDVPKVGNVLVNFKELLEYVSEQVGTQIEKGEIPLTKEEVEKAMDRATAGYLIATNPDVLEAHKDSQEELKVKMLGDGEIWKTFFPKHDSAINSLVLQNNSLQSEKNRFEVIESSRQAVANRILGLETRLSVGNNDIEMREAPQVSNFTIFKSDHAERRITSDPARRLLRNTEDKKIDPGSLSSSQNLKPKS